MIVLAKQNLNILTKQQFEQFVENGYTIVENCLPREVLEDWCGWCEERLRTLPQDYPTPAGTKSEIPALINVDATKLSPRAWGAACELMGGTDCSIQGTWRWTDAFIVNLPQNMNVPWTAPALSSGLWHLDSHWFRCFLDSPEWALLAIVVWRDIEPHGGATVIAPETVSSITRWFAEHPEGAEQCTSIGIAHPLQQDFSRFLEPHFKVVELTAHAGDVIFLSRNLLHAQSPNCRELPRIITRPSITLREPIRLHRTDGSYSAIELNVLHALGVSDFDFAPTRPRMRLEETAELSDYQKKRQVLRGQYRAKHTSHLVEPQ